MTSFAHLPILPVILPLLSGIVLLALRNRSLSLQRDRQRNECQRGEQTDAALQ